MAYKLPNGLRDREYDRFLPVQNGSLTAVAVHVASGALSVNKGDTDYTRIYKQTIRHAVGSEALWIPSNNKKAVITDVIVSVGSPNNEVTIWAGGSRLIHTYLAENGGYVSNFQSAPETQVNGSVFVETSTIGSTSVILTGFEV